MPRRPEIKDLAAASQSAQTQKKYAATKKPSDGHRSSDTQLRTAATTNANGGHNPGADTQMTAATVGQYAELRVLAEVFHDCQQNRMAMANRLRSGQVDETITGALMEHVVQIEAYAKKSMLQNYRLTVPQEIQNWQKEQVGIGDHSLARLLGCIGDPTTAYPSKWIVAKTVEGHTCNGSCGKGRHLVSFQPYRRTVSQLWQYCGVGDPAQRRRRGMDADDISALGNQRAKMIIHLIAEGCMKMTGTTPGRTRSPYRDVYEQGRLKYADRVDDAGKPWSALHQMNAALRLVKKNVLKDLWIVAGGPIHHPLPAAIHDA